nr:hypothetical protein [Catenulispora acidiphila]
MLERFDVLPLRGVRLGDVHMAEPEPDRIPVQGGRGQTGRGHVHLFLPQADEAQVAGQHGGQLPGVPVQAGSGRQRDRGDQCPGLGVAPGAALLTVEELLGVRAGDRSRQLEREPLRIGRGQHGMCAVEVVVQQSLYPGPAREFRIVLLPEFGGVLAQQVVSREPARDRLGHKARPGQFVQCATGLAVRQPGQRAGRGSADLRSGVQAQEPEHSARRRTERMVRRGEHGTDVGVTVAGGEHVQTSVGPAELAHPVRQRDRGVRGSTSSRDGQGQREVRAQLSHLLRRGPVLSHRGRAQPPGQQLRRFRGCQRIQRQRHSTVHRDQSEQPVPAGHHDDAAGTGRYQRPDLGRVPGVVQHQKHPAAAEPAPVQRQ